jgi:hypothetical protein
MRIVRSRAFGGIVASVVLAAGATPAFAATIHVSTGGTDGAGCGTGANTDCATIQGALDTSPAATGDTIQVAAGTYSETTTLSVDKDVTIVGAGTGAGGTTITTPFPTTLALDAAGNVAIVFVAPAASGATIEDLTVDGAGDASADPNDPFRGIDIQDAAATVDAVHITNVEDTPPGGSPKGGTGLSDLNDDSTARTLTADNVTVDNYGKDGMLFDGHGTSGLTVNVSGSAVTGAGPTTLLAQNGILFEGDAAGTISGTTVSGDECNAGACGADQFNDTQSFGIGLYTSGPVTVSNSTVTATDAGVFYGYPESGVATISGDVLSGNRFEGVLLGQGTADLSGNVISGSQIGVQAASYDQLGDPPDSGNAIANLTGNTISGNVTGISLDDDNPSPTILPVLTAHDNVISQNSTSGIANNVPAPQNATSNYWGCSAGPGHAGCDGPTGTGAAQVSVTPFLAFAPPAAAIGPPSISIVTPSGGSTYRFGQVVQANYSCHDAAGGPGIQSCTGTVPNGSALPTSTKGALSFTVTTKSQDGQTATATVNYAVLPDNRFRLAHLKLHSSDGSVSFDLKLPGPGAGDVLETAPNSAGTKGRRASARIVALLQPVSSRFVFARKHLAAQASGTLHVVVKPNARGARLVTHHRGKVFIRLWVTYTPTGGSQAKIGRVGLLLTR